LTVTKCQFNITCNLQFSDSFAVVFVWQPIGMCSRCDVHYAQTSSSLFVCLMNWAPLMTLSSWLLWCCCIRRHYRRTQRQRYSVDYMRWWLNVSTSVRRQLTLNNSGALFLLAFHLQVQFYFSHWLQ